MIKINNTYILYGAIDYFEENAKDGTVYIHLKSGTSLLFSMEDCKEDLERFKDLYKDL